MKFALQGWCLVGFVACAAAGSAAENSNRAEDQSGSSLLGELLSRNLRLATSGESAAKSFEAEFYVRGPDSTGRTIVRRIVLQRAGDRFGAVILAENGIALAWLSNDQMVVLDSARPGHCKILHGRFRLWCGTTPSGDLGYDLQTTDFKNTNSQLELNLGGMIEQLLGDDSAVSFDPIRNRLIIETPGKESARIDLNPKERDARFPIQGISVRCSSGDGMGFASIRIGEPTFRNILEIQRDDDELPGSVKTLPPNQHWFSELNCLCADIDSDNPGQRRAGLTLLRAFEVSNSIRLYREDNQEVDALLLSLLTATSDRAALEALGKLHALLELQVARPEQLHAQREGGPHFIANYYRPNSAQRLEVIAGPDRRDSLLKALRVIILDANRDVSLRVAAIDLIGVIGLPFESGLLDEARKAIEAEGAEPDVWTALSSAHIRNRTGVSSDLDRLRRVLQDRDRKRYARLLAAEALANVDALMGYEAELEELFAAPRPEESVETINRFTWAVAETESGRSVLIRLLDQDLPLISRLDICETLCFCLAKENPKWRIVMEQLESIAMDKTVRPDARTRSARLVMDNRPSFEKRFFTVAFGSEDAELVEKATTLMIVSGRLHAGLPYIAQTMVSPYAKVRKNGAMALAAYARIDMRSAEAVPDEFYKILNKVFSDVDGDVRFLGVAAIVQIVAARHDVPLRYALLLVDVIQKSDDPEEIAVTAAMLENLTDGAFRVGYPRSAIGQANMAPLKAWFRANMASVKIAAKHWRDANRSTAVPGREKGDKSKY